MLNLILYLPLVTVIEHHPLQQANKTPVEGKPLVQRESEAVLFINNGTDGDMTQEKLNMIYRYGIDTPYTYSNTAMKV